VNSLDYLDLDNYKQINDELGHSVGDRVLEEVGLCIRSLVNGGELAFRVGGDEFAMLLPADGERDADELVGHLIASFGRHLDPHVRKLSASFGVATGRRTEEPDELLRIADEAMYAAKRAARRMEIAV
jgi:diguanylate cyclase (GGDEF)-like protein